jgi:formyl-CoA transferase
MLSTLLPPANVEGLETVLDPIPALGAHTAAILAEQGYSPEEVERLRKEGVV